MGRVVTTVKVQSFTDVLEAGAGTLDASGIRSVEFEGIVDTGATYLCLPPSAIAQLGLPPSHTRRVRTANGDVQRRIFKGAEVTIQGRTEQMSVMESAEQTPTLVGYLVLEALDFIVDPLAQKLVPNPEHGGEWMAECY